MLQLLKDEHADGVDRTVRVIILDIYGGPPYVRMIDGQPRARTASVADATAVEARFVGAVQQGEPPAGVHFTYRGSPPPGMLRLPRTDGECLAIRPLNSCQLPGRMARERPRGAPVGMGSPSKSIQLTIASATAT